MHGQIFHAFIIIYWTTTEQDILSICKMILEYKKTLNAGT